MKYFNKLYIHNFLKRIALNIINAINRNMFDLELISVLNMFLHECMQPRIHSSTTHVAYKRSSVPRRHSFPTGSDKFASHQFEETEGPQSLRKPINLKKKVHNQKEN